MSSDEHDKALSTIYDQSLLYPRLSHLYLSTNNITRLPASIGHHRDLQLLSLRDNKQLKEVFTSIYTESHISLLSRVCDTSVSVVISLVPSL